MLDLCAPHHASSILSTSLLLLRSPCPRGAWWAGSRCRARPRTGVRRAHARREEKPRPRPDNHKRSAYLHSTTDKSKPARVRLLVQRSPSPALGLPHDLMMRPTHALVLLALLAAAARSAHGSTTVQSTPRFMASAVSLARVGRLTVGVGGRLLAEHAHIRALAPAWQCAAGDVHPHPAARLCRPRLGRCRVHPALLPVPLRLLAAARRRAPRSGIASGDAAPCS